VKNARTEDSRRFGPELSWSLLLQFDQMNRRLVIFFHALLFVLGFSVVFVFGWGGAATLLGQLFGTYKIWLGKIGGLIVILFGLSILGIIKIPWLYYDTRPEW
jgi:cytochrome c-type biogenesis protein